MKALLWIGVVLVVLGVVSLFVPIPQSEKHSMEAGGVKVSVQTRTDEKVSPLVSAALIVAGALMAAAGSRGAKA